MRRLVERAVEVSGGNLTDFAEGRRDHRLKRDGGLGLALSQMIRDAADRHVFHHPGHPPRWIGGDDALRGRLPRVWEGEDPSLGPEYSLSYGVLPRDMTVERRWVTDLLPARTS